MRAFFPGISKRRAAFLLPLLICMLLFSFVSDFGREIRPQDSQPPAENQAVLSVSGCEQSALLSTNLRILLRESQSISRSGVHSMALFYGVFFCLAILSTGKAMSGSWQISVYKIKYFLIAPYNPYAPPDSLSCHRVSLILKK